MAMPSLEHLFLAGAANGLLEQVPFVDDDNASAPSLRDDVGDLLVLFEDAGLGIQHENRNVTSSDGVFGAFDAEILHRAVDPSSFADSGRVDQDISVAPAG